MKVILLAALTVVISANQALAFPAAVDFAALSLTKDQSVRAIVSNVGTEPCPVQVSFFGADGSLIGKATTVQLKAGESTSVVASQPSKLVRASVSMIDVNPANACAFKTNVETFDLQTDATFASIAGKSVPNRDCTGSIGSTLRVTRKNNGQHPAIGSIISSAPSAKTGLPPAR